MSHRTDTGLYFNAEARAMAKRDRELIPTRLVIAMFSLALAVVLMVSFAKLTDAPLTGQPKEAPIVTARTLQIDTAGTAVAITDARTGEAIFAAENGGFISVVTDGLRRARLLSDVTGNPPVTVTLYETGRLSLHDPASGWRTELSSFGAGNAGVWLDLLRK